MGHNDIVKLTLSPTFYLQNTWAQFIVTIVLKAIDKKGEFNLLTFVLTYFQQPFPDSDSKLKHTLPSVHFLSKSWHKSMKIGKLTFWLQCECITFKGYVTLSRVCHTFKGVSHLQGYVTLSRVCHTFKGMSNFQGYVTLSRVCQTFKGSLNFQG